MAKKKRIKINNNSSNSASQSVSSGDNDSLLNTIDESPKKLSLRFGGCIHEDHKEVYLNHYSLR